MANRLADMHEIAPDLTQAVAKRITSTDLHDKALRDLGAFVHRTIVEDEHTYAVRIDDGAMLDAAEHIERARIHLSATEREQLAQILACEPDKVERELDTLTARAKTKALNLTITPQTRDRARAGRFAYVHHRGQDFADGIWVVNPLFIIDLVHEQLANHEHDQPAREEAFFAGAGLDDDELRAAGQEDRELRNAQRLRQAEATNSNLGAASLSPSSSVPEGKYGFAGVFGDQPRFFSTTFCTSLGMLGRPKSSRASNWATGRSGRATTRSRTG